MRNMKKNYRWIFLFLVVLLFSACSGKKVSVKKLKLENLRQLNEKSYVCTFDGIKHDFIIEMPQKTGDSIPVVLLLHGYTHSADFMRATVGFHKEAGPRGYASVYVSGSISKYEKAGGIGWNSGIAEKGNADVEFLVALAEYLWKEYGFDKNKTFVAGFSNGGFMVHRLAIEAGNTFCAAVSVAGKMPEKIWNERNRKNHIGFFQVTCEFDDVVPKKSDHTADVCRDPAIEDVMDYWAATNGLKNITSETIGRGSTLTKWTGKNKDREVWHLFVKDSHHFWPNEQLNSINTNSLILDFFDAN